MKIKFSILVQPNPDFEADDTSDIDDSDQCIYCVLRSYDDGLTWHHFFTMVNSDQDEIKSFVNDLNKFYSALSSEKAKKIVYEKQIDKYKTHKSHLPLEIQENNKKYKGTAE